MKLLDQNTYKYIPSERDKELYVDDVNTTGEYMFIDEDTFAFKYVLKDLPIEIYGPGVEKMTIVMIDKTFERRIRRIE